MRKLNLVFGILIALLFTNCSIDSDSHSEDELINVKKIIRDEYSTNSYISNFTYNDENLITNVNINPDANYGNTIFFYDAEYNIIEKNLEFPNGLFINQAYTYNSENKLTGFITDRNNFITDDINITYNNNISSVSGTLNEYYDISCSLELNNQGKVTRLNRVDSYNIFEYDSNNNLISSIQYLNNNSIVSETIINYNTYLNPFFNSKEPDYIEKILNRFYLSNPHSVSFHVIYNFPFNKNNIVSIERTENGVSNTQTFEYTYNNGLITYVDATITINGNYSSNHTYNIEYYQ